MHTQMNCQLSWNVHVSLCIRTYINIAINFCFCLKLVFSGLFHIHRLPRLNTLASYLPDSMDLAFKLRRKKLTIEVRHLYFRLFFFPCIKKQSTNKIIVLFCFFGLSSHSGLFFPFSITMNTLWGFHVYLFFSFFVYDCILLLALLLFDLSLSLPPSLYHIFHFNEYKLFQNQNCQFRLVHVRHLSALGASLAVRLKNISFLYFLYLFFYFSEATSSPRPVRDC